MLVWVTISVSVFAYIRLYTHMGVFVYMSMCAVLYVSIYVYLTHMNMYTDYICKFVCARDSFVCLHIKCMNICENVCIWSNVCTLCIHNLGVCPCSYVRTWLMGAYKCVLVYVCICQCKW